MAILVLCRGNCGLSKGITRYLLSMAAADLMVLIFEVILYEIKDGYFPYSFLNYTPVCSLNLTLLFASLDCSVWLTVMFTFDRFVAIRCQTLRTRYCNEKTANVVVPMVSFASILQNVPIYFIYERREMINDLPWSCFVKPSFYTLPIWVAYLWLDTILTPLMPFLLIIILNALTIRHIVLSNRARCGLRRGKDVGGERDPEIVNRRKSITLLLSISGSFVLLWMVTFVCFISVHFIDNQFLESNYKDPFTIAEQSGYMLRCLSSCTNTFIYAVSQSKFRKELRKIILRPLELLGVAIRA
ncbi:probable G-protein coupled receptor 139 [Narcine bancroftii]|uniref:probable G-protein coupled receptor 139 n=1 Tax=Narcine bancroftii TaxID=1343680 RepID=UPI003831A3A9